MLCLKNPGKPWKTLKKNTLGQAAGFGDASCPAGAPGCASLVLLLEAVSPATTLRILPLQIKDEQE